MSSEVEVNRNSAVPSSTLPEVVLAAEEYDYGLNLISTMAATRENIVENGTVMNILSNTSIVGNKVVDLRDMYRSRSSSLANSPGSVTEEVTGRNDSEGVSLVYEQNHDNNSANSNNDNEVDEINVPINVSPLVEEESFAVEDTDTDDDVILVVQPIETIELLGDDDDDGEADVQIVNSDEPIPKPKRLPHQHQLKPQQRQPHQYGTSSTSSSSNISNNTFPATPRLPESSVSSGLNMFSDDEHLAPILKDLLDDHFGQIDFDIPLAGNMHMTPDPTEMTTHNRINYGKSPRGLFVSHLTTEMAIQTDEDYKPQVCDMETQTECSAFCGSGKRKL